MSSGDLDTRLRSAGDSLRRAVEPLDPGAPPVDADRPDRRPLLAAAAVVLVIALVAAAVALSGDDRDGGISTDPDVVPRLVLGAAVVGLPATGGTDLPAADGESGSGPSMRMSLYAAAAPGRPDGTIDVALVVLPPADSGAGDDGATVRINEDGEPVTVRGRPGRLTEEAVFGLSVAWEEAPGRWLLLATRDTGARDELLAMADAGTGSPDRFEPGPTGAGVDPPTRRATVDDIDVWSGIPVSTSAVGHVVGYQSDDGDRMVFVVTFAATEAEAEIVRWMAGAQEPVEVRGHDGWAGRQELTSGSSGSASSDGTTEEQASTSTIRTLVWEEAPGVYVLLRGTGDGDGIGEAEMQRLADSLRSAGDAEWEALGAESDSVSPPDAPAAIDSEFDGGTWAVYLDTEGSICAGIETDSSGSSSCGSSPGGAEVLSDDAGTPLVVYGALPPGAADVRLPGGASGASTATAEDGTTVYAITADDGPLPTEVVFVDAAGQEVARTAVGFAPAIPGSAPTTV